jgi:hypothetical protein
VLRAITSTSLTVLPMLLLAVDYIGCSAELRPTVPASQAPTDELWQAPRDIAAQDLFNGAWGAASAPDPQSAYRFLRPKRTGVNPGMTVVDDKGRRWSVKQTPHDDRGPEGPVEVVLSRVLAAVGYHQPPVYLLPSFTLTDTFGARVEPGGRFRLHHPELEERQAWSWQQNPFVGTTPYHGLLVILLMFNSADLKNSNNSVYEHRAADGAIERWYVVRDLGSALGTMTGLRPLRNDPGRFETVPFFTGVERGYVLFGGYSASHQELVRDRITPADVRWASDLLAQLVEAQWHDAFRAAGYERPVAARFIRKLRAKVAEGQTLGRTGG